MTTTMLDKDTIRQKYAQEREKRLRPDGNAQYLPLEGAFPDMAADPHAPIQPRDPVKDHVTFAFVGGGFSGLVVGARLREAGVSDFRLIDKGGDVGGTWYWNRYPGVQCDTVSMIYLPLLEETGHMPTERYVHGPEIREHCDRIAHQFGLRDKALFHTEVTSLEWQENDKRWRIKTNRGDDFTAKYVGMGTGPLSVAKLPGIPGIERFRGKSFHTSRWDYEYTGGNAGGAAMDKLGDKRVAIIGTGATGVQCIPYVARAAKHLFVFQRTPSSVDERANRAIEEDWFKSIAEPGWQQRWYDNFVDHQSRGVMPTEDYIMDGWTAISRRIREKVFGLPRDQWTPENLRAAVEDSDIEKMNEIRARVDAIVEDPQTAAKLKAWYAQLCKRPCFNDLYLPTFNLPNVTLVDTDGRGVQEITESGLAVNGRHYEVDCIVYASGFDFGASFQLKSGFDVRGRGGRLLSDYWAEGLRTLHGLQTHGFPNAFTVQMFQAANLASNIPHNIVDHARTIAQVVAHAEAEGFSEVEPTQEAEQAWIDLVLTGSGSLITSPDCTPGFWNNEGQGWDKKFRQIQGHPGGPKAFFDHMNHWRAEGDFKGLRFAK
jgi:cyclohexanone monooxygenase